MLSEKPPMGDWISSPSLLYSEFDVGRSFRLHMSRFCADAGIVRDDCFGMKMQ